MSKKAIVDGVNLGPLMAAFRQLAQLPVPANAEALVRMALQPGRHARLLVMFAKLPVNYGARWKEADVLREIVFPTDEGKWRPRFVSNVWGHYKWMMHVMFPRGGPTVVDAALDRKTTKSERDLVLVCATEQRFRTQSRERALRQQLYKPAITTSACCGWTTATNGGTRRTPGWFRARATGGLPLQGIPTRASTGASWRSCLAGGFLRRTR